jgi:hypothetical protein
MSIKPFLSKRSWIKAILSCLFPVPAGSAKPNKEVRSTYTRIIQRFFTGKIENKKVQIMLNALMAGDIKLVINILQKKAKKKLF